MAFRNNNIPTASQVQYISMYVSRDGLGHGCVGGRGQRVSEDNTFVNIAEYGRTCRWILASIPSSHKSGQPGSLAAQLSDIRHLCSGNNETNKGHADCITWCSTSSWQANGGLGTFWASSLSPISVPTTSPNAQDTLPHYTKNSFKLRANLSSLSLRMFQQVLRLYNVQVR